HLLRPGQPELPRSIVAPALHRAVLESRAGVVTSRRDLDRRSSEAHVACIRESLLRQGMRVSQPQLSVAVVAPAANGAVREEHAAVLLAEFDVDGLDGRNLRGAVVLRKLRRLRRRRGPSAAQGGKGESDEKKRGGGRSCSLRHGNLGGWVASLAEPPKPSVTHRLSV